MVVEEDHLMKDEYDYLNHIESVEQSEVGLKFQLHPVHEKSAEVNNMNY